MSDMQIDIFGDEKKYADVVREIQTAVCTKDENCTADVDGHDPDCPVEHELRQTFGF